jgi:cyclomaltodextrinase
MFKKQTLPVTTVFIFRLAVPLLFLLASAAGAHAGNSFLGAIPVQYLAPNEDLAIDMHRFYQAGDKDQLQVEGTPDVDVSWDPSAFQLHVRAKKEGLYDLPLRVNSGHSGPGTILTVACGQSIQAHRFQVKPLGSATRVAVAGSFNGWSGDKNLLTGPDDKGEFSGSVALKPGRYSYKFVVDGKWMADPANDQTEDNGLGDKNSVLVLPGEKKETPVIFADHRTDRAIFIRTASADTHFQKISAIFEGSAGARTLPAKEADHTIEVSAPPNETGFVRVIVTDQASLPSNVVRCPVGAGQHFQWQDAVLYYAFTDRFVDGDTSNDHPVDNAKVAWPANYHGGDLRGVRQKIDDGYFEKLGVNTIWVAPLNRNPDNAYQESPEPHRWYTGYHGYWPVSSNEIDPHIGTARDLNELIDHAHAHGMRVIADLVLHHVHEQHPWWKEHRDWFGSLDLPNGKKNLRLWDEQQFTTWFEPYLPSFDFSKDEPVRALIDNSVWWANTYKLDGFRLDAVKHILPSFWWKFRAALRERVKRPADSPLYLVGETFKDRAGIMSFVGPNMLDGQFDFPLYDQIKETFGENAGDMTALDGALAASEKAYGKETLMSPLIGNHDKSRFMAYADGELPTHAGEKEEEVGWKNPPSVHEPSNYEKLELAQALLMSIDGVPMVYYGDEIGMTGAGDPDNRRDMRFGDKVSPDEKRVLENFQKLGAIRRAHPALRYGSRRMVIADHDLYAFVRADLDDRLAAIFNRGKSEAKVDIAVGPELADGDYVEALSGRPVTVREGMLHTTLPGQTAAFITKAPAGRGD